MYEDLKLEDWQRLQEAAKKDALTEPELLEQLELARAGDVPAKGIMIKGMLHLAFDPAYDWSERSGRRRPGHIMNNLYFSIGIVVDRFVGNNRSDLIDQVLSQFKRTPKAMYRESSPDILVPCSTKGTRKKKQQSPYNNLVRIGGCISDSARPNSQSPGCVTKSFDGSSGYRGPIATQDGELARVPSKHCGYNEGVEMVDLLDEFTPEQQKAVPYLIEGVPICQIAKETSMSLYATRQQKTQVWAKYGASSSVIDEALEGSNERSCASQGACTLAVDKGAQAIPDAHELALSS